MGTPILDLDALVPDRPTIRIRTATHPNGKLWELRTRSEMSIVELRRIMRIGTEAEGLLSRTDSDLENMTDADATRLGDLTDQLLTIAFAGPYAEVSAALSVEQKVAVMQVFSESLQGTPAPAGRTRKRAAKKSTGAAS